MTPRRMVISALLVIIVTMTAYGLILNAQAQYDGSGDGKYGFELVADGLTRPLFYIEAPDDSGRRFIVEQDGRILMVVDGEVQAEPFLDIQASVNDRANEQGLLGLAFHPDFAENGLFFVNYTRDNGNTVIARYAVSADDPNVSLASSGEILLVISQPYANHNGGMLAFGPDGYLYIGMGDGGSAGDPDRNGQNPNTLLGSILRIDVDNPTDDKLYGIPTDNPFADGVAGAEEVWAYGLRNPWRFSFDMANGDLYIADVGQNNIEEVNYLAVDADAGANFGWRNYEGSEFYQDEAIDGTIFPVAEYTHEFGCSVTGGYVYHGELMPELQGTYFYADYCTGIIWALSQDDAGEWSSEIFLDTDFYISSFGQDQDGELYVIDQATGTIHQLVPLAEDAEANDTSSD